MSITVWLIVLLRSILCCFSKWPSLSQIDRLPGTAARDDPNDCRHAVCILFFHHWLYKPDNTQRRWNGVVLHPSYNGLWWVCAWNSSAHWFNWYHIHCSVWSVATLTQGFYCYRAAILTKSKYAVSVIGMVIHDTRRPPVALVCDYHAKCIFSFTVITHNHFASLAQRLL